MRYFNAYRMDKWLFTRCSECAAVVAEVDQETHTEWHGAAARKVEQLRQMYTFAVDNLPLATQQRFDRLAEAYIEATNPGIDMDEVRRTHSDRMESLQSIGDSLRERQGQRKTGDPI